MQFIVQMHPAYLPSQVVADDDCQVTLVVALDGNGAVVAAYHVTFLAVTLSHTAPLLLLHT